ncbi:MAG: ABC transporter ATP-binding protein [Actinomycetota bacterium]|nr:ABC transporter ATP-binding protein [Actinomycetota bacterium]
MVPPAIVVEDLRKSYGRADVLRGVDLRVEQGEIVAFLGPNGAGKTTTIEILEGFRAASSGRVEVLGTNPYKAPRAWREDIGIVLQSSRPPRTLTVRELLDMHGSYYRSPRSTADVLASIGLVEEAGQRIGRLSGGQQRRVDLELALIGDPRLVFLDEPTTGFDPTARREAWGMIAGLRDHGCTVFLTTHYLDEAQYLADNIAVISSGRIIARGTTDELAVQIQVGTTVSWLAEPEVVTGELRALLAQAGAEVGFSARRVDVHVGDQESVARVLHELTGAALVGGWSLSDLRVHRPTLEETYLALIEADTDTVNGVTR